MEGGVTMDFKDNPGILGHMRICLVFIAKMKNVKLEHPIESYDMDTMLEMFNEMEDMPDYRSRKRRLIRFKDDVILFFANIAMWIIRGFVSLLAKAGYEPARIEIAKIRETHDRFRNRFKKE